MKKFNRREFVHGSIAGSAIGAILGSRDAFAHPDPNLARAADPLKISILSYAFNGLRQAQRMNIFGYLESCKYRFGLQAADIWNGFFPTNEEDFIQKVKDALLERELVVADLCCDQCHVWDDDPTIREQNYTNAKRNLEIGKTLGARFVRIDAGSRSETWNDEMFDHIVERFKEYAQYAYDNGFKMGAENHWGPEENWPELKRLYEAVDHRGFGLSIHLGMWAGDEEAIRIADREVAPWACHTHVDWNRCTGTDLHEKLANLWRVGYDGYYSVEHHSGENEYKEVALQVALVRGTLERFRDQGVSESGRPEEQLPIWRSRPNM